MDKHRVAESRGPKWTRIDDYVAAMARRRTARRSRQPISRTQPETPRALLSTLPFLALIGMLAVLALGIMVAAFPGFQPLQKPAAAAQRQQGVAARGWFQQAQRDMHR